MRWWRGGASRQWKARAAGFSGPAVAMSAARRSSGDRRSGRWLTGTSARSAQPADRVVASQSAHRAHRLDATHRRRKRPQGFAAIQRDPSCGRGMTTSIAAGATSPNRPSPLSRASRRPRRSTQGRRGVARPAGQLSGWMNGATLSRTEHGRDIRRAGAMEELQPQQPRSSRCSSSHLLQSSRSDASRVAPASTRRRHRGGAAHHAGRLQLRVAGMVLLRVKK